MLKAGNATIISDKLRLHVSIKKIPKMLKLLYSKHILWWQLRTMKNSEA